MIQTEFPLSEDSEIFDQYLVRVLAIDLTASGGHVVEEPS